MKEYLVEKNEKFNEIIEQIIKNNFPETFIELLNQSKIILTSDSIRKYYENKKIDKIDFFCIDWDILEMCIHILMPLGFNIIEHEHNFCIFEKDELIINLVFIKSAKSIEDVLEHFGFTIDKIIYLYAEKEIIMHKNFLNDLENKKLIYCGSKNPTEDWKRYEELVDDGYFIDKKQLKLLNKKLNKAVDFI
ncbi:MAG: hypothetical protein PHH83_01040 [Patescibacteria group bacterium]|nr:hypothetical protein [Patescibacteria group bacterium]